MTFTVAPLCLPVNLPLPTAAKLTQKVTALQTSEASALQQLSSAQARLASCESALLKSEQEVDNGRREMGKLRENHHRELELERRENRVCVQAVSVAHVCICVNACGHVCSCTCYISRITTITMENEHAHILHFGVSVGDE